MPVKVKGVISSQLERFRNAPPRSREDRCATAPPLLLILLHFAQSERRGADACPCLDREAIDAADFWWLDTAPDSQQASNQQLRNRVQPRGEHFAAAAAGERLASPSRPAQRSDRASQLASKGSRGRLTPKSVQHSPKVLSPKSPSASLRPVSPLTPRSPSAPSHSVTLLSPTPAPLRLSDIHSSAGRQPSPAAQLTDLCTEQLR